MFGDCGLALDLNEGDLIGCEEVEQGLELPVSRSKILNIFQDRQPEIWGAFDVPMCDTLLTTLFRKVDFDRFARGGV